MGRQIRSIGVMMAVKDLRVGRYVVQITSAYGARRIDMRDLGMLEMTLVA